MGEALGNPHLPPVRGREALPHPAAERGRAAPKIHRHVEHLPRHHAHELALRLARLEVQAAQHAGGRARVVVLDERARAPGGAAEPVVAEGLHEEAARVFVHLGLEDEHAGNGGGDGLHDEAAAVGMNATVAAARDKGKGGGCDDLVSQPDWVCHRRDWGQSPGYFDGLASQAPEASPWA